MQQRSDRIFLRRAGRSYARGLLRARCCPTRISCRVARPFQRASRTDQIVPGTTARKNAKPVCSERGAQLLAERISNIRPKAGCWDDPGLRPFAFRSGSRASVFSWRIPVIISTRFTTTIRRKWRWRAKGHTHSAPRNLLEDLVVPETRVGVFIRFGRGGRRDSRFLSLHLRLAQPGANTGGKVRSSHGTRFDNAGTRSVGA